MAAYSGTVDIKIIGTAPNYSEEFNGALSRVHIHGHLWLTDDYPGFTVTFKIVTPNFFFDDGGGAGNAAQAFFIGRNPSPPSFDATLPFTLVGAGLGLSVGNTELKVLCGNSDHNKYFYQLNFVDASGYKFHTGDPIIVDN